MVEDVTPKPKPGTPRAVAVLAGLVGVLLLAGLIAAGVIGYRTYTERYRVTKQPNNDIAISQIVRQTFRGASDLKVASLSGTVQATAASKSLSLINTTHVVKAPFEVDYFVDLSRMGPSDFLWNAATRTLTVRPPDVRVGAVNVDEANTYLDKTDGMLVTRGAMKDMRHQASVRATSVARQAAIAPDKIAAARRNARADLSNLLSAPLKAAGMRDVNVDVVFPGEGSRSTEQWDVTRAIPEVLGNAAS